MDNQFTEYMRIMVWVIEHTEGGFLVDTGENAKVTDDGYFKDEGFLTRYINKKSFILDVKPEDEVGPQLERLGYNENDLKI